MTFPRPRSLRGMLPLWPLFALLATTLTTQPASAQLTGTLTSGNATYTQSSTPTTVSSPDYLGEFLTDSGGANHLYGQWMFYRVGTTGRERPFGNYGTTSPTVTTSLTGSFSGNTATYNLTDSTSTGTRFTATWNLTLLDGATAGSATLNSSLTVRNQTASTLTISLFHYLDFDLNGASGGNSAIGGQNGLTQTEGVTRMVYTAGTPASRYQAGTYPGLEDSLLNTTTTNLNNTGLPFAPGDFTAAYQWDLTLAPGASTTINSSMAISPVPEPALGLGLATLGLGLGAVVRRRLRRSAA